MVPFTVRNEGVLPIGRVRLLCQLNHFDYGGLKTRILTGGFNEEQIPLLNGDSPTTQICNLANRIIWGNSPPGRLDLSVFVVYDLYPLQVSLESAFRFTTLRDHTGVVRWLPQPPTHNH